MTASSLEAHATSPSKQQHHHRLYSTKTFRLLCMLSLTFAYFVVEIVIGNVTNSVALVADALHMLSDVISLLIALIAVRIAKRRSDINTYGWVRAEIVGANINTVFLLALCLTIVFDIIKRYIEPEPIINVNLLLIVGSVGLAINIIGLFLFQGFHGHSHGGGGAHGHTHHASNSTSKETRKNRSDEKDTEPVVPDRLGKPHIINNNAIIANDADTELFEKVTRSSEFKTHSSQPLCETIDNYATNTQNHSHSHVSSASNAAGAAGNNAGRKDQKASSMNMHGVFLHVLADALGSAVVIISALLIKFVPHNADDHKHWTIYIDPTLSVIIVIVITISTIPLFKETLFILLHTVPKHIEIDSLKKELLEEVPEVKGIHELHVWRLTGEKIIASAHLHRRSLFDYMIVADKVKHFFHSKGIHSTTMQFEYKADDKQTVFSTNDSTHSGPKCSNVCLLQCTDEACDTQTCCTRKTVLGSAVLSANNNNNVQRPPVVANEISIKLEDERQQQHDCSGCHHLHTHISINESNHDEKF
ncbi:unnamed protein product [Didymodactylos carnosus]|uniref:Zinc transporter 1 n=2 Tax=Didymodactylos carnosus TaxID=1234261 RepID=A0A8S2KFH9_9BILA|nr:unnamed protein product [Didymodactylos carnosus]